MSDATDDDAKSEEGPICVDQITLICNGCKRERTFTIEPPLIGAQALIEWLKTKPPRCGCGATHCAAKARLVPTQ